VGPVESIPTPAVTELIAQIQQVLDDLQPYITSHGGRVEFVELKEFVVFIRFYGTCLECPLSFYTLTYGIERHIKDKIPSILRVEALE
jgi:Fe-S cluster biogenesis protein NfuA